MEILKCTTEAIESISQIDDKLKSGFIWLNCDYTEIDQAVALTEKFTEVKFYGRHIEDLKNYHHPCFFDKTIDYNLVIVRMIDNPAINDPYVITTHPLNLVIYKNFMLTVNLPTEKLHVILQNIKEDVNLNCQSTQVLANFIVGETVDEYLVLRKLFTDYNLVWQTRLLKLKSQFTKWHKFFRYKTILREFKVLCMDQQDVVDAWRKNLGLNISDLLSVRFADLYNHLKRGFRYFEQLDNELDSVFQIHYSIIGYRTGQIMKILTVLSSIFLPLTLLTGIFGMNFIYMPFLKSHFGFEGVMILMLVIALGSLTLFKWRDWLN